MWPMKILKPLFGHRQVGRVAAWQVARAFGWIGEKGFHLDYLVHYKRTLCPFVDIFGDNSL